MGFQRGSLPFHNNLNKSVVVARMLLQKQAGFFVFETFILSCAIGILSFILNQRLSCSVQCHKPQIFAFIQNEYIDA